MFPCLKEDGGGPQGALCPLEQVLESAPVKDSFCSHSPASHIFPSRRQHVQSFTESHAALFFAAGFQRAEREYPKGGERYSEQPPSMLHLA